MPTPVFDTQKELSRLHRTTSLDIETTGLKLGRAVGVVDDKFAIKHGLTKDQSYFRSRIIQIGFATGQGTGSSTFNVKALNSPNIPPAEYGNMIYEEMDTLSKQSPFFEKSFRDPSGALRMHNDGAANHISTKDVDWLATQSMAHSNTILIQNTQFENMAFTSEFYERHQNGSFLEDMYYSSSLPGDHSARKLYLPPEVSNLNREATELASLASNEKNAALRQLTLNDLVKKRLEVLSAYSRAEDKATQLGIQDGKPYKIVKELQHYTQAVYSLGVQKGLLDPTYLHTGTSVDLLTQAYFGRREMHTAGADARDQMDILEKNIKLIDELHNTGNISDETKDIFKRLNSVAPLVEESTSLKAVRSHLSSLIEDEPNVRNKAPRDTVKVTVRGRGGELNNIDVPLYSYVSYKDANAQFVVNNPRHSKNDTFNATVDYIGQVQSNIPREEVPAALRSSEEVLNARIELQENLISAALNPNMTDQEKAALNTENTRLLHASSGTVLKAESGIHVAEDGTVQSRAGAMAAAGVDSDGVIINAHRAVQRKYEEAVIKAGMEKIAPKSYIVPAAILAAVGMGGMMMNGSSSPDEGIARLREQKRTRDEQYYPDKVFKMNTVEKPYMPHGVGFANWNERNTHHEY